MGLKEPGLRGSLRNVSTGVSAIPDSVVLQFFASTFIENDSTWQNDIDGQPDISITGDPSEGQLSDDAKAIVTDGSDDHGLLNLPSEFAGDGLEQFSVEFVLEYTATGDMRIGGQLNNDGDQDFSLRLNNDDGTNTDNGNLAVLMADDDGTRLRFAPSTNPNLNDGNRHDLSVIVHDATENDVEIIIDGTSVSLSFSEQEGPNNFTSWDNEFGIWAWNNGGSIAERYEGKNGAWRWHDQPIEEQTISDYQ